MIYLKSKSTILLLAFILWKWKEQSFSPRFKHNEVKIFAKYLLFGYMLLLSPLTCTWFPFLSCLCSFVNLQQSFMFFKGLQNSLKFSNCLFPCAFSFNPLSTVPAVWHKVANFKLFRHTTVSTKSICISVSCQYLFLLPMYRLGSVDFFFF